MSYVITGASRNLGRRTAEHMLAGMLAAGLPQADAELIASFGTAIREGQLEALSTAVQDLTGRAPATLRSVLEPALVGTA